MFSRQRIKIINVIAKVSHLIFYGFLFQLFFVNFLFGLLRLITHFFIFQFLNFLNFVYVLCSVLYLKVLVIGTLWTSDRRSGYCYSFFFIIIIIITLWTPDGCWNYIFVLKVMAKNNSCVLVEILKLWFI